MDTGIRTFFEKFCCKIRIEQALTAGDGHTAAGHLVKGNILFYLCKYLVRTDLAPANRKSIIEADNCTFTAESTFVPKKCRFMGFIIESNRFCRAFFRTFAALDTFCLIPHMLNISGAAFGIVTPCT